MTTADMQVLRMTEPAYRVVHSDVMEQCELIEINTNIVRAVGRCAGIEWIASQLNSLMFNNTRLLKKIAATEK